MVRRWCVVGTKDGEKDRGLGRRVMFAFPFHAARIGRAGNREREAQDGGPVCGGDGDGRGGGAGGVRMTGERIAGCAGEVRGASGGQRGAKAGE